MGVTRRRLAVVLVVSLLVAGCGGDGTAGGGSGEQSSPEAVAAAYRHIAAGEFEQSCALVLPDARSAFAAAGTDCQSFLAGKCDVREREAFLHVWIDPAEVERNGDTAVDVTFGGRPSRDHDTPAVRQDDEWWVTAGN